MRRAVLAFVLLALLHVASWSQPESGSIVRDPHSTPADLAVPLCPSKFDDSPESNGIAGVHDKGLTPPKVTFTSEARITDEARKAAKENRGMTTYVLISLIVDEKGNTNSSCILRSAGYGLDASSARTASQYRVEPARLGDKAVPYRLSVVFNFRIN